jgi:hypothetical protein
MNSAAIKNKIDEHRTLCKRALWDNDMPSALLHVSIICGFQIVLRIQNAPERCSAPPPSFSQFA